jgi:hypothetical protein
MQHWVTNNTKNPPHLAFVSCLLASSIRFLLLRSL